MKRALALLATVTIAATTLLAGTASASEAWRGGQHSRYATPETAQGTCTPLAEVPYKSGTLIRGYGGFDCSGLGGTQNEQGWVQIQRWTGSTWVSEGSPVFGGYDVDWWRATDTTGCTSANLDATRRNHSWVTYTVGGLGPYTNHAYSTGRFIYC